MVNILGFVDHTVSITASLPQLLSVAMSQQNFIYKKSGAGPDLAHELSFAGNWVEA
jgi:hypothetical protein